MSQTLSALLKAAVQDEISGREPVNLGADDLYLVVEGSVEVFWVDHPSSGSFARRTFLYAAGEGEPVPGLQTPDQHQLFLVPVGAAKLLKCDLKEAWETLAANPKAFQQAVKNWAQALGELLVEDDLPVLAHQLPEKGELSIKNRGAYYTDDFCFLEVKKGKIRSTDQGDFDPQSPWLLMPPRAWFSAEPGTELTIHDFSQSLGEEDSKRALRQFHLNTVGVLIEREARSVEDSRRRIDDRAEVDRNVLQQGWSYLTRILNPPPPELKAVEGGDPLMAACYLVGKKMNATISPPQRLTGNRPLDDIARASGLRVRRVKLEEEWWKLDSGPIIGWTAEEHNPVAFIPSRPGVYNAVDPQTQQTVRVTKENAHRYANLGAVFQMRLPAHPIGLKELFQLALRNARADLLFILLLGAGAGTLALAVPVATKYFFDQILPMGNSEHLKILLTALLLVTVTNVCFALSNSVALIRFGGRFGALVASMTFDRLLTLPMPFYRQYTMGDLAQRTLGVTQVRELVTGGTLNKIVTSVFSLISFFLLVYYDPELALIASGLLAVNLAFLMYNGFEQLKAQRKAADVSGEVNGVLFQILDALPKIRVAGAESRFFQYWSRRFSEQMESEYRSGNLSVAQSVFTATFPVVSTFLLFAYVGYGHEPMATGTLLAFLAAFGQCTAGIAGLSESVLEVSEALPQLERTQPILSAIPEVDEEKLDPGVLHGNLDLSNVVFRYLPDQPPVLNGVSLTVKPGEFVALVGGTGAGKSTVLNMLLGFDTPESGAVFFDGKDLQSLDVQAVRQQLGVVLQDGKIVKDTVFRNLATGRPITREQAWDALQMVGLQDDIEEMPGGLDTVISEKVFSGGQAQRLLIARAIVTRPRIIIFDEATSALDNKTQAVVSKSLDELNAARVVVAHRLSTIKGADRIYVFEKGRIVETGTFAELSERDGLFKELIGRQQA